MDFSVSIWERSGRLFLFIFMSVVLWLVSFGVWIYIQYFFDVKRNKLPELIKKRSKFQEKNMSCERTLNFDQWKTFSKRVSQWEFDYGLFTNLPRIIVARDFSRVHSKSKEVSYLSWQNTYPNLKTTCHIKLKFF